MENTVAINIPFEGFYNTSSDAMLDDEVQMFFEYDDSGNSNIPDEFYWSKFDWKAAHTDFAKLYLDAYCVAYESATGIALDAVWDELSSPKEYNFETDRIFAKISTKTLKALYAESKKDKHKHLIEYLKENCTSYDGFWSHYSNDINTWLAKGFLSWDHNEVKGLLIAVLNIHASEADQERDFSVHDLLDRDRGNGAISGIIEKYMPPEYYAFSDYQRSRGIEIDYDTWEEEAARLPAPGPYTLSLPL